MNYYDLPNDQLEKMNIDYDFCACLEYNPQPFNLLDVDRVLAVIEGENDGPDWHWVVKLKDNRISYMRGGCDYTGWDCQSWAESVFLSKDKQLWEAINEFGYDNDKTNIKYFTELSNQIKDGKKETWREKKDKEFGLK